MDANPTYRPLRECPQDSFRIAPDPLGIAAKRKGQMTTSRLLGHLGCCRIGNHGIRFDPARERHSLRRNASCLLWPARPGLLDQKRQVVYPIILTYTARIDDVGEVVF